MTSPISYNRLVRFLDYANAHTAAPYNASDHDAELDAVQTSIASLITNLAQIQRTDGALKNASVHPDAFTTASKALIGAGSTGNLNWTPRGLWLTATAYALGNVVQNSTTSYVCAVAHTSGVFATDYAAGKWIILGETFTGAATSITFTPYSHIAATNVQAAIQEVVDEAALLGGSASQAFSIMDSTTATQAASVGQVQKGSLLAAVSGGSSDVITATLTSSLTTLSDGQRVEVEATAANGTTAPTFALAYSVGPTTTPAKTIKKGAGLPLLVGDIPGLGFKMDLMYSLVFDCWLLLNPAYPVGQSTAAAEPDSVRNIGLSFSVGSSALTISLKSASGSTPSSSDTVTASLRSSSASTGAFNVRSVAQATNLTVPSTATLGHSSGVASRINHYLIDNLGTLELAVSTKFFGYSGIVSTTAISAAATSDSVMYSTSARASVPFVWIGLSIDTQTTAGTWAGTPTTVDLVRSPARAVANDGEVMMRDSTEPAGSRSVPAAFMFKNRVLNPDGTIYQRTVAATADDTYFADRWNMLTQTNTVTPSVLTDPEDGFPKGIRITQSQAVAQRFGFSQIILGRNCKDLRGKSGVLVPRIRCSSSQAIRYAILGWTGTEDSVTSDVVLDWTSSTYTAGNFFLAANVSVLAVGSQTPSAATWTSLAALTVALGSTFNNIVVFVWTEATAAQNVTLDFDYVQFERGSVATEFERRLDAAEFNECKKYRQQVSVFDISGYNGTAGPCYSTVTLPVQMRAAPTVAFSNTTFNNCAAITSKTAATTTAHIVQVTVSAGPGFANADTDISYDAEL